MLDHENSILITAKLTDQIYIQELDYNIMDQQIIKTTKSRIYQLKNTTHTNCRDELFEKLTPQVQQHVREQCKRDVFLVFSNAIWSCWVCTNAVNKNSGIPSAWDMDERAYLPTRDEHWTGSRI